MTITPEHLPDGVHGWLFDPVIVAVAGPFRERPYMLYKDAFYYTQYAGGRWIKVPEGYRSDLLTVPWIFTRIFPAGGWGKQAALIHDYLVDYPPDWCDSATAHKIFREAMEVSGVPRWRIWAKYQAVRLFGPRWKAK